MRERRRQRTPEEVEKDLERTRQWRAKRTPEQLQRARDVNLRSRNVPANKARAQAAQRARYQRDKERFKAATKAWQTANRTKVNEYSRQARARNPEARRRTRIKSKYRLTDEQFDALEAHCGICDSCGVAEATHIDHNHTTGAVRGKLCWRCNVAAGLLKDQPERARRLGDYLRKTAEADDEGVAHTG